MTPRHTAHRIDNIAILAGSRIERLSYLAGAWARHGQGHSFVLANSSNKAMLLGQLLESVGASGVRVECAEDEQSAPAIRHILFEPTGELEAWLARGDDVSPVPVTLPPDSIYGAGEPGEDLLRRLARLDAAKAALDDSTDDEDHFTAARAVYRVRAGGWPADPMGWFDAGYAMLTLRSRPAGVAELAEAEEAFGRRY